MKNQKALVLFSGGLDSRLAVKLLEKQRIEVLAVTFKLPFSGGCCNTEICTSDFPKENLKVIDCTKGKLFKEYIDVIKKPKHGRGTSLNPCIDCRIFIIKKAKDLMKKLKCNIIATGEVLGERPMSQNKKALGIVEKQTGIEILRPLSAKLLPDTVYEKKGLIDKEHLEGIQGRTRKRQIQLAKMFKISYPNPGGGCVLCEKEYSKKLIDLFKHEKNITPKHIELLRRFRHFRKKGRIILGKDHQENLLLEKLNKKLKYNILIPDIPGPTAIYDNKEDARLTKDLVCAYSSKDIKQRKKFEKIKI